MGVVACARIAARWLRACGWGEEIAYGSGPPDSESAEVVRCVDDEWGLGYSECGREGESASWAARGKYGIGPGCAKLAQCDSFLFSFNFFLSFLFPFLLILKFWS